MKNFMQYLSKHLVLLLAVIHLLQGCSGSKSRYQQKYDSSPDRLPNAAELNDAIPRAELKSRGGNRHYQVHGRHYKVLHSAEGFTEEGIASWYGKKFHGHLTSNGEIYDMYAMTAAHKNLPLPTYVQVTNLENKKSVIVRVNDRGPFHQNRIIDLSYSAAYKLDMLKKGTAKVSIQTVTTKTTTTDTITDNATALRQSEGYTIQVFATNSEQTAENIVKTIQQQHKLPAKTFQINNLFRVQIGPILKESLLQKALSTLQTNGYPKAFILAL